MNSQFESSPRSFVHGPLAYAAGVLFQLYLNLLHAHPFGYTVNTICNKDTRATLAGENTNRLLSSKGMS